MSTSTDGQISYGILFDEGYEFPWSTDEYEDDIDNWWREVNGYINPIDSPYTEDGAGYKPGYSSNHPQVDEYWRHPREWKEANPIPVELVNYQSGEVPAYILAVPSTVQTARRGYPEPFVPESLIVSGQDRQALIDFCAKYDIEMDTPPSWYLSSYWG